ncbi:hypothetical protein KIW84_055503 [Lathyrus oleraceus]|uniref:Uncharacterized protein n=1 Tax=Pisum sativum TaxID=3888 RepID=A0A9D5AFV4_PEA|nr:hypothetical protein KIW84_055503 [Pisum sativum]
MKTISWNNRGLGNPMAIRALLWLLHVENPSLVFLMETRLKEQEMFNLKFQCDMNHVFVVECSGQRKERAGGITLIWKYNIQSRNLKDRVGKQPGESREFNTFSNLRTPGLEMEDVRRLGENLKEYMGSTVKAEIKHLEEHLKDD